MRRAAALCVGALAACAGGGPPVLERAAAPDRALQERACDRAVAEHVGLAPDRVATVWRETSADGVAVFEARDGGRLHTCAVDAGGRVLRILHPR